MTEKTQVLIVGAGPCGLAAAGELLRQGVRVRVFEAEPAPRTGSRAILLWPPALELFGSAAVMPAAESRGVRATALNYRLPGGHQVRLPLTESNRPLLLPQADTEELLDGALRERGGVVERGMRVTDVDIDDAGVTVTVTGPRGVELVESDWLIAADGVRSTVRQRLGIDFVGAQVPDTILVAEGRIEGTLSRSELHYYLGPAGGALLVPLPSGRFRFGTPVAPDTVVTRELVQRLLDERGPGLLRIDDLSVRSTFTSQERVAARLRHGRCFLVGDAAHTHSAIGGQGLNLGLQDVRNLTWKLGGVIAGQLRPEILDTYDTERRHAAVETVRTTRRMARVILARGVRGRLRNGALRALAATGVLARVYPPLLAGWRQRYPAGSLIPTAAGPGGRRGRGRAAGARAPHGIPAAGADGALLRLVTTGPALTELAARAAVLADGFPALVRHTHTPGGSPGFLLLRPDGYVATSGAVPADLELAERLLADLQPAAGAPSRRSAAPSTSTQEEA